MKITIDLHNDYGAGDNEIDVEFINCENIEKYEKLAMLVMALFEIVRQEKGHETPKYIISSMLIDLLNKIALKEFEIGLD
nr:MAG TPA: hypothetical protein [Caudoviricetes sp.]